MRTYCLTATLLTAVVIAAVPHRANAQNPTPTPAPTPTASATQAGNAKTAATVEASVGTAVADHALTGAAESFPKGTEKLYCLSKVTDAADSEIEHVWYKGDTEVARVKLKVAGSPWRTYSSKTLGDDASGDWRCDVVQNGTVLQSVKFKVE